MLKAVLLAVASVVVLPISVLATATNDRRIKVKITAGSQVATATFIDNATTRELIARFPLTVPMKDPYSRELVYRFKGMRPEGVFTPPGLDSALQMPGSLGGMNWGSVSIYPTASYMIVNDMRLGLANYMILRDQGKAGNGIEMGVVPQLGTLSPLGVPCQAPPIGTLTAVDLKTHQLVWQLPVGTVQDTGPMGIRMGLPLP